MTLSTEKRPLASFLIKDVVDPTRQRPTLVSIHPDQSISEALELMAQHNLLSLPVQSRAFPEKYSSIINLFDILSFIVKKCGGNPHLLNSSLHLDESVESSMTLDVEEESYRIWEVDFRDTLEKVPLPFQQCMSTHSFDLDPV
jgi:hypothetical protein